MKTTLILLAALTATPQPFIDAVSPETSQLIVDYLVSGKSFAWLDYNGDGEMNLADAVGVLHKYEVNVRDGNELGLTEAEAKEQLVSGIGNAIYRKSDAQHIHDTFSRHEAELSAAMEDMEFLEDAFYYEMCNHEYAINMQGKYDVLDCLGFDVEYENEMACLNDDQKKAWKNARNRYYKDANEKGWY